MFAVVGHVEWIHFIRVAKLPAAGEISAAQESWEEVGGGGSVAAAQMLKLAGEAVFFTALGRDEWGKRCYDSLLAMGLHLQVAWRDEPQRRAVTFIDDQGERTITVLGPRLAPAETDALAWSLLDDCQGCYFTAGPVEMARRARHLTATTRVRGLFVEDHHAPDAWVGSFQDQREQVRPADLATDLVVMTEGEAGGHFWTRTQSAQRFAAQPLPAVAQDAYGCGDSFAGALAYGLGSGLSANSAIDLAARCGASVRCGRGPYAGQLNFACWSDGPD